MAGVQPPDRLATCYAFARGEVSCHRLVAGEVTTRVLE